MIHPDIASQLFDQHRAELMAEAAHRRLVHEAWQARAGHEVRRRNARRWWWVMLPSGSGAAE